MNGIELIAQERNRQIAIEGWTSKHDDGHRESELAMAAACYAMNGFNSDHSPLDIVEVVDFRDALWPFDESWWKPSENRIDELVKAGALIAAEIDRLQRA